MSLANYALDNTKENSVVILFYDLELPSWCSNWEYLSLSWILNCALLSKHFDKIIMLNTGSESKSY